MGITAQQERNSAAVRPPDGALVREPVVAEKQHSLRPPVREPGGQRGIVEAAKMMGAGIARDVRHEFVLVAAEKIDVPLKPGAELRTRDVR